MSNIDTIADDSAASIDEQCCPVRGISRLKQATAVEQQLQRLIGPRFHAIGNRLAMLWLECRHIVLLGILDGKEPVECSRVEHGATQLTAHR